jgi:hypothetical protein
MKRGIVAIAVIVWVGVVTPITTARAQVPAKNLAPLLLRVLAYDRNLSGRVHDERVTVGVLYMAGSEASESCSNELPRELRTLGKSTTVAGMTVQAERLAYTDAKALENAAKPWVALYVCPGLEESVPSIMSVTRRHAILTFSGSQRAVENGLTIGFVLKGSKAAILINLVAARAEGINFNASLLKVGTIIKK